MLTLASMVWAAYAFVAAEMHMEHSVVPQPVTIAIMEDGVYTYNIYEDAIYVPAKWTDECENQRMIVYEMSVHFNNMRSRDTSKLKEQQLQIIKGKWVCLQDKILKQG